jgi:hypothetical protein
LPAPDGPVMTVRPGAGAQGEVGEHRAMRAGMGVAQAIGAHVDAGTTPAFGNNAVKGAQLGEQGGDGLGTVGGGVELGTDAPDRPIGLGREQDRDKPGHQRDGAVGQAQPDRDGHDGDRDRGEQLEGSRGQEGQFQRPHRRATVALADLTDDVDLALGPAVGDQRRQAPHHVDEMAGERRQSRPAAVRVGLGGLADERREEGQQRQREHHDEGAQPVDPDQRCERQHGHHGGVDERWEEARGIRLDGGGALRSEGDGRVGSRPVVGGQAEPADHEGPP